MASAFADIIDLLSIGPSGDDAAVAAVRAHDRQLTKPPGSLGALEDLVEFLARWQGKPTPTLDNPMVAIFAANHGVTDQGVSAFPREVTAQMVANFTAGGAAISQICALHELNLRVFELALDLPTGDITLAPAMEDRMCAATIAYGMEAIAGKPDLLAIGEMGIGNTTVAAAIYAALFGGTGADWVGRGTGVDDAGLQRKADAVDRALAFHKDGLTDPLAILARLGGREIAAMLGAIIATRQQKVPLIVDGFVATAAAAVAQAVNPDSIAHCIFGHVSAEHAHARVLEAMGVRPLLNLDMRLGEGSGAALAMVLAKTALHLHKNMATFGSAGVSDKGRAPYRRSNRPAILTSTEAPVDDELAILAATRLATLVERFAPGLLIGLHLVGSVADGDFQPGRSDLDFVAVLAHPADGDELEALGLVHRSYAADGTLPLLDGIWITEGDLAAGPDTVREGPTTHDNRFAFIGHGNRNPVTWATLPRARSVVGALDAAGLWADAGRLKAWTRQNVEDYWARWLAAAQKPLSPLGLKALRGSVATWGVLGLSRMLYTLRTGEIASKTVAGEWVLGMVEPHWRGIVAEALRIRRTGRGRMSPIRRRTASFAFMAMLLEIIRSPQPASE